MTLKAVEPRRLYRQVADQIRAYLDSENLPVGARLPTEREFADRLNVSRPTVREALIALEVEGRIRIRVGSGIYVAEPPVSAAPGEHDGPFEVLRARTLIEAAVAQEAAAAITPEHIARLDALLERMAKVRHPSNEAIEIDRDFHVAIAAVLGNAVIEQTVLDLFNRRMSPFFGRLAAYFENQESWTEALAEHRAIRDALAARDGAAARAALCRHLERSQERFSRSFGENGPEEARKPEMTSA
ncbi:MAG: FCD domain-containing protein [Proteobacteria bacterium]|nr:FCD domain-containing protein [Pseudomonadota bacterium]